MHERSGHTGFQLCDGETQGGDSQAPRPVDGAVPFELGCCGQAELMGQVAPLVVVLSVLMFVEGQDVGTVLVQVDPVLPLLAQLEQAVHVHFQVPFQEAEAQRLAVGGGRRRLEGERRHFIPLNHWRCF